MWVRQSPLSNVIVPVESFILASEKDKGGQLKDWGLSAEHDGTTHNKISHSKYQALMDSIEQVAFTNDAQRVFHGRGGMFPGLEHLTLDWFPPAWLLTSRDIQLPNEELEIIQNYLETRWSKVSKGWNENTTFCSLNWVYQCRSNSTSTQVMTCENPENHRVSENGMKFMVHLLKGMNHGIFLDMANGRQWVQNHAKDQNVLNLFAYTCGFSVAALHGGATQVVNLDMGKGALKSGQKNHELNGLQGARFWAHDIFKTGGGSEN